MCKCNYSKENWCSKKYCGHEDYQHPACEGFSPKHACRMIGHKKECLYHTLEFFHEMLEALDCEDSKKKMAHAMEKMIDHLEDELIYLEKASAYYAGKCHGLGHRSYEHSEWENFEDDRCRDKSRCRF